MPKSRIYRGLILAFLLGCASAIFSLPSSRASQLPMPDLKGQFNKKDIKSASQVTMQADQLSFSSTDSKASAKGNVVVNGKEEHLFCDQLQLDRAIQEVVASGNVYLDTPQEQVFAQGITYNFQDGTGEFRDARVYVDPYQIKGQKIDKVSENYMTMDEGYMTTCDLDEPHYRIGAHRMDIYMHDRAVIHGMKVYLGSVPVMYLPYFVQDLQQRSIITFEPGEKKDFGFFLLTTARIAVNSRVKLNLHLDNYERNGTGEGFDVKYDTPNFGSGLVSAYYIDENHLGSDHIWDLYKNGVKVDGTTHHERYRVIWRHKWQIDRQTNIVLQYYKIHDYDIVNNGFLKTYFPREYQQNAQNSNLDSYFLLTRVMPHGTLTFNIDTSRVNPAIRGIERIPEVKYVVDNQQIGKTGFYAKSVNTFSDLTDKNSPQTFNNKTIRFDTNDDISHPFKVGFISFNPHVGGEETYYSRTTDVDKNNILRGLVRESLDMSTKFYRVWNYHTNFMGLDINGLRHVITPTITYLYQSAPTFPSERLNQFDPAIDDLYRIHELQLGLENKLQTKRNGQVVDLLRLLITNNYGLNATTHQRRGFNAYDSVLDFNPTDWLTLHNDNEYDFHFGHWNSENFDATIHGDGWAFSLGNLYTRTESDQLTTEVDYTINPKWRFKIYNTFLLVKAINGNTTTAWEHEYILTRDLHEWEMDLAIDQMQGQGTTFYVLFRLKASPGMKFNLLQSNFQPSRPGSQN